MLERQKLQRIQRRSGESPVAPIAISQIERNGELLFLVPDAERHERRIQRAVISDDDRLFWATITIACGTPSPRVRVIGKAVRGQWRRYGKLPDATNDLNAFYEYYRPMQLGGAHLVGAVPGLGKSPGFFDTTERSNNPTRTTLRKAVGRLRDWVAVDRADPEYTCCQVNFRFAGHGMLHATGPASIVLADAELDSEELASWMIECIPWVSEPAPVSRLDPYLDCCHAAAIARSARRQLNFAAAALRIGQIYCACLDDEESYEFGNLPHGVFTSPSSVSVPARVRRARTASIWGCAISGGSRAGSNTHCSWTAPGAALPSRFRPPTTRRTGLLRFSDLGRRLAPQSMRTALRLGWWRRHCAWSMRSEAIFRFLRRRSRGTSLHAYLFPARRYSPTSDSRSFDERVDAPIEPEIADNLKTEYLLSSRDRR